MGNGENEIVIDLRELLGALWRGAWLILLCGTAAGALGFCTNRIRTTIQYQSTTRIYVLNRQDDSALTYSDVQLGTQLARDFVQIIKSRYVLEKVAASLGLEESAESLASRISVAAQPDTRIVAITVTDPDPETARRLADEVRETAAERIKSVMDIQAVNLVDEANLPSEPVPSRAVRWLMGGAMVGCFLSGMVILTLFLMDDTLRTAKDAGKYLGLSTLGVVPCRGEAGAGRRGGLAREESDIRFREAFRTLRTNIELSGEGARVICLTSCIPREGKSKLSYELARAFGDKGERVLLVDADLRGAAMGGRQRKAMTCAGLVDCLVGMASLEEALCSAENENFQMIIPGRTPANPSELLGSESFGALVRQAREQYDMVVIDTPALGSVIDAAEVARVCDGAILVAESGAVSFRFAGRVLEQLRLTGCPVLGCILNKADRKRKGCPGMARGRHYEKEYNKFYGGCGD